MSGIAGHGAGGGRSPEHVNDTRPVTLQLRFWGTRGSVAAPGPHTVRYGGNTPCVEVRTGSDALVILDAGTGIRELGRSLVTRADGKPIVGDIFLSHGHWDHIQGLPFFEPLFTAGNRFTIWSAARAAAAVDRIVREQMSPAVFPVPWEKLPASVAFAAVDEVVRGPGYELRALPVCHPGGALGFRLCAADSPERFLVYVPDNELSPQALPTGLLPGWRDRLVDFARGARTLVHDATYTLEEYAAHEGWGHSHASDAVRLALDAGVDQLVLFHHKPDRTDDEVDRAVAACKAMVADARGTLDVVAAAEGMTLTV